MDSDRQHKNGNSDDLDIPEILHGFLVHKGLKRDDVYEIAFEDAGPEAYFVLTGEYLYKVDAESGHMEEEIKLEAITKADITSMVGGGIFEVYMDKVFKEVARFSNTRMKSFGRISKLINEYIKNTEIKDEGEVERDIACPQCKRPLPERDAICPFCLNKKKVLWRFMGFLKPYRAAAAIVFVLLISGLFLQMVGPQFIRFILDEVLVVSRPIPEHVVGVLNTGRDEAAGKLTEEDIYQYALQDRGDRAFYIITSDERLWRIYDDAAKGAPRSVPLANITTVGEVRMDKETEAGTLTIEVSDGQPFEATFSPNLESAFGKLAASLERYGEGKGVRKVFRGSIVRRAILWCAGAFLTPDGDSFSKQGLLLLVVCLMVARWFLQLISDVIKGRMGARMGNSLVKDLRSAVFNHLQRLSFSFYDKRQTGALMSRVAHDTERIQNFVMQAIYHFLPSTLVLIIILLVMLVMNWKLTLWVLVPTPLIVFGTFFFWQKFLALIHRYFGARARLGAEVNDAISGIRVIRAFGQETKSVERFEHRNYDLYDSRVGFERYIITVFTSMGYLSNLGFFLIYLFGGMMVLNESLTVGEFMAFTMYLGMFLPPLRSLSRMGEWLSSSLAAAQRVFDVMDTEPEIKTKEDGVDLEPLRGEVTFEDATFGYESFKPVLKNVDLHVKEGELIGLVGESGVGKTTTTNLICRFYDVPEDQGRILIDGVPIKDIKLRSLRSQIGIVLQEPFLFQGTVAENIAYPKPDASMDEIIAAAKAANAHDFIMKFNEGYETYVGERGGRLSGGEKQRISIARAILHDPRILILDEATSSVDSSTEKKIQEALDHLTQGRTTFAIAHRLSTLRRADRLVVLEKGEIAETGTHEELMKKKGVFWKLVNLQKEATEIISVGG